ncbi:40S ribosomal protein SA [Pteropus alecto]|uniref:40S ribosomal protein SA n=1 Tax=Pteropus alecto TaxID=9402 RepID=L5JV58_PTEAL|nr:40S ribosomal protein SA [Pteropus alecto]
MRAREVLRMRGIISREHPWEVTPHLCFCGDPEEIEKEEQAAAKKAVTKDGFQGERTTPAPRFTAAQPEVAGWSEGAQVPLCLFAGFLLKSRALSPPLRLVCRPCCSGNGMRQSNH